MSIPPTSTYATYADSPRNPNKYLGQDYRFAPCYLRNRDPFTPQNASTDTRPKENQGKYPLGSFWVNTVNRNVWLLVSLVAGTPRNLAEWTLISQGVTTGPVLSLSDTINSIVLPSTAAGFLGNIQLRSLNANLTITSNAGNNSIDFLATSGSTETLTGDDGVAVSQIAGTIQTLGNVVDNATHSKALFTTNPSTNIERWDIQVSTAIPAADVTKVGIAAFNSAQFTVTPSTGFVSLVGGTTAPLLTLTPNAATAPGTSPTLPNGSGTITLEGGATFATGTQANPIRTNSLAANTIDIQTQLAGSNAAVSTANNFGVAQFDSNSFTVASGFVTLTNGGTTGAVTNVAGDDALAVVPSLGRITFDGLAVANATNAKPVFFKKFATSVEELDVQIAGAFASSVANNVGLASFNNTQFTVDANGFVSLTTSSTIGSVALDAATTPIVPNGSGQITLTGGQVATGTVGANVIRTRGNTANSATIEIQRSTVSAASNSNLNGVSHFSSAQFGVDANGFVTFIGSTTSFPWTDEGGNFAVVSNQGYFCTALLTATLPATPAQGDVVRIVCDTASVVTIKANTSQFIRLGNVISAAAGTAASTRIGDSMDLVYRSSSATWYNIGAPVGTWTIT